MRESALPERAEIDGRVSEVTVNKFYPLERCLAPFPVFERIALKLGVRNLRADEITAAEIKVPKVAPLDVSFRKFTLIQRRLNECRIDKVRTVHERMTKSVRIGQI